jgi:hypothetical protein
VGWHLSICVPHRDLIATFFPFRQEICAEKDFHRLLGLDLSRTTEEPLEEPWPWASLTGCRLG